MNKSDFQRLLHIQRYCEDIAEFINRFGEDFDVFVVDRAYSNAVSMCILQIGELANGLSKEFRLETKDKMPWDMIRGMRNWVAHAYAEMDEEIIWDTAINDIPNLLLFCKRNIEVYRQNENNNIELSHKKDKKKNDFER